MSLFAGEGCAHALIERVDPGSELTHGESDGQRDACQHGAFDGRGAGSVLAIGSAWQSYAFLSKVVRRSRKDLERFVGGGMS
jgi:hypothetical protein